MSKLKFPHASGNSMSIGAPATNPASDLEIKLPSTVGSANQILKNSSTPGTLEFGSLTGTHGATDFTISDGNLVVASGHGIDFSAQTATSATSAVTTSELLDGYEEGTFLPFVEGSGGSGSTVTYQGSDNRRGYYIRVGKMVTVWCIIGWTGITSGWSGTLQVGGLPFAHDNTDHSNPNGKAQSVGGFYCQNLTLPKGDDGWCTPYLYGGYTTKFKILQSADNTSPDLVTIQGGNNMNASYIKYIQVTFSYPAA